MPAQRFITAGVLLTALFTLTVNVSRGEPAEPEQVRLKTADGLSLFGKWYPGGKGVKSDSIILVHNYKSDMSKGWEQLAKALQEKEFSVLAFDFRGHGKSADKKALDDPEKFLKQGYNKYSGMGNNAKTLAVPSFARFQPAYYPYLINDIAAARRFIDTRNDSNDCNAGRVFIVADKEMGPLVLGWIGTEFHRNGVGPAVPGADAPKYVAGRDIVGVVWLSSTPVVGAGAIGPATTKLMTDFELYSDTYRIQDQIKNKVAMAFIYSAKDPNAQAIANNARFWGVPIGKTEEKDKRKYLVKIEKGESLRGIELLDDKKQLGVEKIIIDFITACKNNPINGNDHQPRNINTFEAFTVPLDVWGLR